jgi:hypothetical protein
VYFGNFCADSAVSSAKFAAILASGLPSLRLPNDRHPLSANRLVLKTAVAAMRKMAAAMAAKSEMLNMLQMLQLKQSRFCHIYNIWT